MHIYIIYEITIVNDQKAINIFRPREVLMLNFFQYCDYLFIKVGKEVPFYLL